jgi:cellulose synthase (UDP-forming)
VIRKKPGLLSPLLIVLLLAGILPILFLMTVPARDWSTQLWLGTGIFLAALALRTLFPERRWMLMTLISLSLYVTGRYAWWRATRTLGIGDPRIHGFEYPFIFLLFAAELYSWVVILLGYVQSLYPLKRRAEPLPEDTDLWPEVDVFITTYNEPLSVVRPTVLGALNMDWPADRLRVFLLDDGNRDEFRRFAEAAGIEYLARPEHRHAKAGNINFAFTRSHGDYIAVFDCDHIPTRSFLQTTIGVLENNPRYSFVQTPHHFYSPDPYERNLNIFHEIPNEGALFYGVVQDGNDFWNSTTFCGSCAVLRREALDQVGGIAVETVTEDAHTSLKLHKKGWSSAYLNLPQAAGLATTTLSSHIRQRIRWARGMIQIFRIENPLITPGLGLFQRLCYLNAMLHFLFSIPRLVFLVAPLAYLYFGIKIFDADAYSIAAYGLPALAVTILANSAIQGSYRHSFWNEVYETTLAPYILLPTLQALLAPKRGAFNVTAKDGVINENFFDYRISRPFVILWLLNLGGLVTGIYRYIGGIGEIPTIVLTLAWTLHNMVVLGATLAVGWESTQRRYRPRIDLKLPARIIGAGRRVIYGETEDLSDLGTRLRISQGELLSIGERLSLHIAFGGKIYDFPCEVVGMDEFFVRLNFLPLTLEEERNLVLILYGRADAWIRVRNADARDRILLSLGRLSKYALLGQGRVLRALFTAKSAP